jgi:CubicO group peptidase (beta-lactamase class C family)
MGEGLRESGIARLHEVAESQVGSSGPPGLVALVARGEQVHVETAGQLSLGGGAVQRSSLFRIASTSKPIVAAATLALAGERLLSLDEPVDRLLPELADRRVLVRMDGPLQETVPAARAITTRDLLTFTFGFGMTMAMFTSPEAWPVVSAEKDLRLTTLGPPDPDLQPDPDTWIANLGTLPLLAQPGERWFYNTGASVLGVLIARAAQQPLADVLRSRIFEPLGMRDTAFWTTETERLATSYRSGPDGLAVWDEPDGRWSRPPAFGDGASGLLSTVDDLLAFARMLLAGGGEVLTPEAARSMCTDQLTDAQRAQGGLGPNFFNGRSWGFCQAVTDSGAFGWDGGLGTSWLVDPARELTIIVLTQRMFDDPGLPRAHRLIQAAAYDALA